MEKNINQLLQHIKLLEEEFRFARDTSKPFYTKKEILLRLRLARQELSELQKDTGEAEIIN